LTSRKDFTPEEWNQLLQSPVLAGFYVIFSDPNSLGMFNEFRALFTAIFEQPVSTDGEELVRLLVEEFGDKTNTPNGLPGFESLPEGEPEDEMEKAIKILEEVVILLETKTSPGEAAAVKTWLFGVAERVSEASKEGSRFGFGGELVSKKEKYALSKLRFTLRV